VNGEICEVVAKNFISAHQIIQAKREIGKGPGNPGMGIVPAVKSPAQLIPGKGCHLNVFIEKDIVVVIKEPADIKAVAVDYGKYDKEGKKGEKIVARVYSFCLFFLIRIVFWGELRSHS
jgi:hypothetical protein